VDRRLRPATLSPELIGQLHIVHGFGTQEVIWTCDRADSSNKWTVHYGAGRILPAPADSAHAVRLVRSFIGVAQPPSTS
jgi:hypothetical protein